MLNKLLVTYQDHKHRYLLADHLRGHQLEPEHILGRLDNSREHQIERGRGY